MINKKKNKISQIIFIILIILYIFIFLNICSNCFAANPIDIYHTSEDVSRVTDRAGQILWVIMAIGIATGTGMLAYIGLKFITTSPEGKAEIKKQAFGFILGAFLLMSGSLAIAIFVSIGYSMN